MEEAKVFIFIPCIACEREREKRMDENKSLESKLDQLDGVRTRAINFLDQLSNLETLVKKLSFFLPE